MSLKDVDQILQYMKDGWELAHSTSLAGRVYWLQQGGIGKGGECVDVYGSAVRRMEVGGLIVRQYGFPESKFRLVVEVEKCPVCGIMLKAPKGHDPLKRACPKCGKGV